MAVKQYIPAIKYGNLVAGDEIESGAITSSNIAAGAVGTTALAANAVTGAKLSTGVNYSVVAVNTNGTSAVSVFGASGIPTNATITGVYLVSLDTTAGNITVENPAATVVATIAKGTASGALVGATSLANTAYTSGTNLIVKSSSAGNATVFIAFTAA